MTRLHRAGLAIGLLAAVTTPAHADEVYTRRYVGNCSFVTVNDTLPTQPLGGENQWSGEAHAAVLATSTDGTPTPTDAISVECTLWRNGTTNLGVILSASGTGVATDTDATFTFTAGATDAIQVCEEVRIAGETHGDSSTFGLAWCHDSDQAPVVPEQIPDATSGTAAECGEVGGCDPTDELPSSPKFPWSLADPDGAPLPGTVEESDLKLGLSSDAAQETEDSDVPAGLNYQKMREYALAHALSYNSAYRSFPNDCTNFISQVLRAGGWKFDKGWYRSNNNWWYNSENQTFTWAGAENWAQFALKRTDYVENVWRMNITDILQIDYNNDDIMDHSMVVTDYSAADLYMSYHTNDTRNRSLRSIMRTSPAGTRYIAYRT